MNTITLEEHFLTTDALKATDRLRDKGLALSYHEPSLVDRLLDVGAGRIADMDACGIDLQVLSLAVCGVEELDSPQAVAVAHDTNEQLASAVRAYPTRFAGFATLALQEPEKAAAELEHCVKRLGFKGALINGMMNGTFLDHPRFTPVLEAAQSLDAPIYVHPAPIPRSVRDVYYGGLPDHWGDILSIGAWGWHSEIALQALRLIVSGVFDRLPKLNIIIGHMGENLPFSIARADSILSRPQPPYTFTHTASGSPAEGPIQHRPPLKRKVIDYFRENFYATSSGFFTLPPLLCALQVLGADHLLFSVDYPFTSTDRGREFLDRLSGVSSISPDDMKKFTHETARKLLKL